MKYSAYIALATTLAFLAGCSSGLQTPSSSASIETLPGVNSDADSGSGGLSQLVNLDYSNGSISIFAIENGRAKETKTFTPAHGRSQGLAMDRNGRIYTTITSPHSKPCAACVEIFNPAGGFVKRLDAPTLQSAPGAPSLTDVSVDARDNVYVSDYGQQAVYFFPRARNTRPTIVVQNSQNAASVLATPDGANVVVSGGCGFASVRPYARVSRGQYTAGSCFGIGTIALIGGAIDDAVDVMTPVDGAPGLVSVSSPAGGNVFTTPDQRYAEISGVAFNGDASIAYVADHKKEAVYAFARPANGWLSGQPKHIATYKGFKHLDIIAVPQ